MTTNKINIALCADKNYLEPLETLLKSICYHNSQVYIYIIHTDIPEDWLITQAQNLAKFNNQLSPIWLNEANPNIQRLNQKIMPNSLAINEIIKQLPNKLKHVNELTYARFLIPELIQEDRVLYLDSDIVVNASLTDLFNIDMRDYPIAAVEDYFLSNEKISHSYKMDIPAELKSCISYKGEEIFKPYFNAGVILWNLAKCRQENIVYNLLLAASYYQGVIYADQDILNFVFFKRWVMLDARCNVQANYEFTFLPLVTESPWIIHYITDKKPWIPEYKDETIFHPVYHHYKNLTWQSIQEYCLSKNQ
jgi:raw score 4.09